MKTPSKILFLFLSLLILILTVFAFHIIFCNDETALHKKVSAIILFLGILTSYLLTLMLRKSFADETRRTEIKRLTAILQSTSDLVGLNNPEGTIIYLNESGKKLLGWEDQDLTKRKSHEVYSVRGKEIFEKQALPELHKVGIWKGETTILNAEGQEIPVSQVIMAHKDDQGKTEYFSTIMRDMREYRKEQEEDNKRRLRIQSQQAAIVKLLTSGSYSKGSYQDCLKAITEIGAETLNVERASIWFIDKENRQIYCVDLFQRNFNSHSQDIILRMDEYPSYFEALENARAIDAADVLSDPRTAEFADGYLKPLNIRSMLDSGIRVHGELIGIVCFECISQQYHWSDDEVSFAGELADQVAHVLMAQEQKKAEEALRQNENTLQSIFRSSPVGIGLAIDQVFIWVNEQFCHLVGYSSEELVGKSMRMVYPDQQEFERVGHIKYRLIKEYGSGAIESKFIRKDGRVIDVWISSSAIDHSDLSKGVTFTALDISERKQADEALKQSERKYRELFENMRDGWISCDLQGKLLECNAAFLDMVGYTKEELFRMSYEDLTPLKWHAFEKQIVEERILKKGYSGVYQKEYTRKDGHSFPVEISSYLRKDENGKPVSMWGMIRDVTERVRSQEEERKLSLAMEQSPVAVIISRTDGVIEYVNPKFTELSGYLPEDVIGQNVNILKSDYVSERQYQDMWKKISGGRDWSGEMCSIKKNGESYWEYVTVTPIKDDDGVITNHLMYREDLTTRKEYENQIERQANYDALTDLPNRILALDRLSQALMRAQRSRHIVGIMFVDLDQFKYVNDTLGHSIGDMLLIEASKRFRTSIRDSDTIARLGGDEFLVVLPDLNSPTQAELVANKLLHALTKPFHLSGQEVFITASVGITIFPNDGFDPDILLRNADAAMYRAKDESRNTVQFFTSEMNDISQNRMEVESHLRHALERQEFYVTYQPLMDMRTEKITGAEALLRWNSNDLGMVFPDVFIPLAEETGLIITIGEWVLEQACLEAKRWRDNLGIPLRIAVNVSSKQFKGSDFTSTVSRVLNKTGLPPEQLELEITEGILLENVPRVTDMLHQLSRLGVNLSIDDFGTGYSALNYLKKFPFKTLKIDRSFVSDIMDDTQTAALTKAIISMAHDLDLEVIGEGVESEDQLEYLKFQGCDLVQGYYYSRPVVPEEFVEFARRHC